MFIEERHQSIMDLLEQNGKVLVKDLSSIFNVSESMIRKDLQLLEKKHLLKRTYGGAIHLNHTLAPANESFRKRVERHTDLKEQLARTAFSLIEENDTIFLDASTTSYMIAKLMITSDIPLTLITNMLEIASLIPSNSKMQVIFIGGDYHPLVGGSVGSYSIQQIRNYRCNKAFIGCTSVDLRDGSIHTSISEDANTKKAIMSISNKLFLIMLNEKFEAQGTFTFSNLTDFHGIITETLPTTSVMNLLEAYDIPLLF